VARLGVDSGRASSCTRDIRAIACTHARRVEVLQVPEGNAQLLGLDLQLLGNELRELLDRLREIAAFVERFYQERDQVAIAASS